MLHVAAEVRHVLLLPVLIPYDDVAIADRRTRGAAVMSFVVPAGQQAVGHVPRELAADTAAAAEADALVLSFKIGAVVDIAPAQRAGVEAVLVRRRRRVNHRAIQLGMLAHGDVIPAFAGKDAGLLHLADQSLLVVAVSQPFRCSW